MEHLPSLLDIGYTVLGGASPLGGIVGGALGKEPGIHLRPVQGGKSRH